VHRTGGGKVDNSAIDPGYDLKPFYLLHSYWLADAVIFFQIAGSQLMTTDSYAEILKVFDQKSESLSVLRFF
jgi:hypothetical protein